MLVSILAVVPHGMAQSFVSVYEPRLGFVAEAEGSLLRPIRGPAEAATIGSPIDLGVELKNAVFSPAGDYVLAAHRTTGFVLLRWQGNQPEAVPLFTAHEANAAAISATGSAALLYDRATGRGTLLRGLPEAPRTVRTVDVGMFGQAAAAAIDDRAATVLASFPDGESSLIWVWEAGTARIGAR
ncbi:MAG: hypothetical protein GY953_58385, partial [bacterium]|nr:hypothetical protein [bacterium]